MSTPCSIEMYPQPLETSLSDLDGAVLDVFLARKHHLASRVTGPNSEEVA